MANAYAVARFWTRQESDIVKAAQDCFTRNEVQTSNLGELRLGIVPVYSSILQVLRFLAFPAPSPTRNSDQTDPRKT